MLAPTYRTAEELRIPDAVRSALIDFTLEKAVDDFNFDHVDCCIMGYIRRKTYDPVIASIFTHPSIASLFGFGPEFGAHPRRNRRAVTLQQAQQATVNFLTTGKPDWSAVLPPRE